MGVSNISDPTGTKLFIAFAGKHRMRLLKADVGDAYAKARRKRAVGYMWMCKTILELDADGMEMVYKLMTPLWGEQEAGFEWDEELHETLTQLGWSQVPGIPALYVINKGKVRARLIKIVDDVLIAEDGDDLETAMATVRELRKKYDDQVTYEADPTAFAGFKIERGPNRDWLTLSQPQKVIDAAKTHAPWLREGSAGEDTPTGTALQQRLDALHMEPLAAGAKPTKAGKMAQAAIGSIKYVEQGVMPKLSVGTHRLSSVMSNPPDDALPCARGVIAEAHKELDAGVTYYASQCEPKRAVEGGRLDMALEDGAPSELEASADASTCYPRIVHGALMTYAGAGVYHKTKKIGVTIKDVYVDGEMVKDIFEAELVGTVHVSQEALYARRYLRAMGETFDKPTRVLTDSLSGARVLNNVRAASRSRPVLWRCAVVQAAVRDGELEILHVADENNPADFLTKWLSLAKTIASDKYARGAYHARSETAATLEVQVTDVQQCEDGDWDDDEAAKWHIIDECRMVHLRHNAARLIQLTWRIAKLQKRVQPPTDGPPSHEHTWRNIGPQCASCDNPFSYVCIGCGAQWCPCYGYRCPRYGPAVPGPAPLDAAEAGLR